MEVALLAESFAGDAGSHLKPASTSRTKQKAPAGRKGLADGHDPHVLDVSRLSEKSWAVALPDVITRCWTKPGVLPVTETADLVQAYGKVKQSKKECAVVSEILGLLKDLFLTDRSAVLQDSNIADVNQGSIEQWVNIVNEDQVKDGIIE